jgi:hypothetical protein
MRHIAGGSYCEPPGPRAAPIYDNLCEETEEPSLRGDANESGL